MFAKALYFSDASSCTRILATKHPKEQKSLGRKVENFNDYKWMRVKSRIVKVGSWYKYCQNAAMRGLWLGTGVGELVEAARRDRVWGIGYNAEEAEGFREQWGENRLGKALMRVRERLRDEEKRKKEEGRVYWEWERELDWEWDGAGEEEEPEDDELDVDATDEQV
jgi:ribA/ribD-fused uncharacterized protein